MNQKVKPSILKPGLLISLKTTIRGGVTYSRTDIEADHRTEEGARRAVWSTQRVISDAEEHDKATTARSAARAAVTSMCASSAFGLLCPQDKEQELADAIQKARDIATEHNDAARITNVQVFVLVGRIAQTDEEAARAIGDEVRALVEDMQRGIKATDVEVIREAATKARALESMLSPEVAGKVSAAVEEARAAAREIVKQVRKGGTAAASVVAEIALKRIDAARFAFLDMDAPAEVKASTGAAPELDMPGAPDDLDKLAQPLRDAAAQISLEV